MPAIGNIYELTVAGTMHGQGTRTVLHARISSTSGTGTPTEAQFEAAWLASAQVTGLISQWKAAASNEWTLNFLKAQRIHPSPRTAGTISTASAGAGTVVSSALPSSVAAVARKRTEFGGRRYRGRVFIPGIPVSDEIDSALTAAAVTKWTNVFNDLELVQGTAAGGVTHQMEFILWHRDVPSTGEKILSVDMDSVLRNQRRRQLGKGI